MTARNYMHTSEQLDLASSDMEQERLIAQQYRRRLAHTTDERLSSLFAALADAHDANVARLRVFLDDVLSQQEVTQQINDMFL